MGDAQDDPSSVPMEHEVPKKELRSSDVQISLTASPIDSKVKLERCMEEFKKTNYVFHFCNSLIKAQDMHEELRDKGQPLNSRDSLHFENTFYFIKTLVINGLADTLVEIIFAALQAPKPESNIKKQLLSNFLLMSEYEQDHREYLNQLIVNVVSIVESYPVTELIFSFCDKAKGLHMRKLIALKRYVIGYRIFFTNKLLFAIFHCCLNKLDISFNVKKEIEYIVVQGIPLLETHFNTLRSVYKCRLSIVDLKRRSALQFIKDLFAEDDIYRKNIGKLNAVMKVLDDYMADKIARYVSLDGMFESDDDSSEDSFNLHHFETIDKFNLAGACHVPKEHIWWLEYKHAYFD